MNQVINLSQYIRMGGDVKNLNYRDCRVTATRHYDSAVTHIIDLGENTNGIKLFQVQFADGTSHRYAGMWIEVGVTLVLDPKYVEQ
jgi:hypothetical protein